MLSKELETEAKIAWIEYGKAIKKAFNLKGYIEAEQLLDILKTEDEKNVKMFIQYIKQKIKELSESKWVGEH